MSSNRNKNKNETHKVLPSLIKSTNGIKQLLHSNSSEHFDKALLDFKDKKNNLRHTQSSLNSIKIKKCLTPKNSHKIQLKSNNLIDILILKLQSCYSFLQSIVSNVQPELSTSNSIENINETCNILSSITIDLKSSIDNIYNSDPIKLILDIV